MDRTGQGGQSEGSGRLCEKQGWSEVDTVGTEGEVNGFERHSRGGTERACRWIEGGWEEREMAELSTGRLRGWAAEWMDGKEPLDLDPGLSFRLFLNGH